MAETIPPRSLSERYKKRPPEDDREPEDEVEADAGLTPAVNTACFGTRIRSAHQRGSVDSVEGCRSGDGPSVFSRCLPGAYLTEFL